MDKLFLPDSTAFHRRIPKQKFYEHISVSPALKRQFIEQIKIIYWNNKIAASTINLPAGSTVTEIEVFLIHLNGRELDETVLRQIDREIPYHIVHLLEYDGKYQAWAAYKEIAESGKAAFRVDQYYHTDWLSEDALPLHIDGLDLDSVYDNFVRQIAGDALTAPAEESLRESVERDKCRRELEKQIAALQVKMRREKQFNKQVVLNGQLKELKHELENLV